MKLFIVLVLLVSCASGQSEPTPPSVGWSVMHCISKDERKKFLGKIIDLEDRLNSCLAQ